MPNRPVEDQAITNVMAEWRLTETLNHLTGLEAFYLNLHLRGWKKAEIAIHRGQIPESSYRIFRGMQIKLGGDDDCTGD